MERKMLQGHLNTETALPIEAGESPDVLFDLGLLFASGRGAPVDLIAAHKWFNLAALKGRTDAIELRREVAAQMSADEIAAAQREARAWITSH